MAYDADGLIIYPTNLEIMNIVVNKTRGCNKSNQIKSTSKYILNICKYFKLTDTKLIKYKLINHHSKNNNCGIACLKNGKK